MMLSTFAVVIVGVALCGHPPCPIHERVATEGHPYSWL
jgi:hypothetical protein